MNPKIDRLIRKGADPVLHTACAPVGPGERLDFLDLMERVCKKAPGVGLAAPQVGVAKRVIYTHTHDKRGVIRGRFMINPVITAHGTTRAIESEACLSYPGVAKRIARHRQITVRYENLLRVPGEETFYDYEARVIQHEMDHLDGVCKVGDDAYHEDVAADLPVADAPAGQYAVRRRRTVSPALMAVISLAGLSVNAGGFSRHRDE